MFCWWVWRVVRVCYCTWMRYKCWCVWRCWKPFWFVVICKWTSPILCDYMGVWGMWEPGGLCSVLFWVLSGLVGVWGCYCCVLHHYRNHAIEFITIYEEPFIIPHYPTIRDFSCCFRGTKCITIFFVWAEKWCTFLIASQQHISILTEFLTYEKMGQIYISVCLENMMTSDDTSVEKWPTFESVMTCHWFSGLIKPYWLHIPCRFQQNLTAVIQKIWTNKKQYKIPI